MAKISAKISVDELNLITNILKKAANEIRSMENEEGDIFYQSGTEELKVKLRQKAWVVVDLLKSLYNVTRDDNEIIEKVKKISKDAFNRILKNDYWGLCFLLDPKTADGKNNLEKLIEELERSSIK